MRQNYTILSDEQLLFLIQEDDQRAFDEVYSRFWRPLFGIAYSHLKEASASEDAIHDVFANLWANRHRLEVRHFRNYLAISVKYIVLTSIKRKGYFRKYEESQQATDISFKSEQPDQFIIYKSIMERLEQEIAKLPEKCRLVYQYSREQGLSNDEIAEKTGTSVNTVKNQLAAARKQIRDNMKDHLSLLFFLW